MHTGDVIAISLLCIECALLSLWVYSLFRPRLQNQLLRKSTFHNFYAAALLLFFWISGKDPFFTHDKLAWLLYLVITCMFLLGELSIEIKSGWWG